MGQRTVGYHQASVAKSGQKQVNPAVRQPVDVTATVSDAIAAMEKDTNIGNAENGSLAESAPPVDRDFGFARSMNVDLRPRASLDVWITVSGVIGPGLPRCESGSIERERLELELASERHGGGWRVAALGKRIEVHRIDEPVVPDDRHE